jgi:hypothetical protein
MEQKYKQSFTYSPPFPSYDAFILWLSIFQKWKQSKHILTELLILQWKKEILTFVAF